MSKFWIFSGLISIIALALVISSSAQQGLDVQRLDSVCSYQQNYMQSIDLKNNELVFEGAFRNGRVASPTYSYTSDGESIVLKVDSGSSSASVGCRKFVSYRVSTSSLETGDYSVKVLHDGRSVYDAVVKID